jgi:hypothetical protein
MNPLKYSIIILVTIALFLPISCKKKQGKTITISFDITGRILSDCDSTPVYNFPIKILVPYTFYEKSDYHSTKDGFATTSEFKTDVNGYYHIQTTLEIKNVLSVSNDYAIVNDEMFNGIQVFSDGGRGFTFTSGNVKDAYFKKNPYVEFLNGHKIFIADTFNFIFDTTQPLYLHLSSVRDSNLTKRISVIFGKGCRPCYTNIFYSDSAFANSLLKRKTWYTYEVKLANGKSFILKKDSFYTGCNEITRIYL